MNKFNNYQQPRIISLLLMIVGIGILLFTVISGSSGIAKSNFCQLSIFILTGTFSSLITILIVNIFHRKEVQTLKQRYSQLENAINFNFQKNLGMQVYSSSIVVVNYDGSFYHCPTVSGIGRYCSWEDYLNNAVIPYLKEKSVITNPNVNRVLVSIVEGRISEYGLIQKVGEIDKTLHIISKKLIYID